MRELEKIAAAHKRGKFDMPEKDFLALVFCPYEGNGVMDKRPLKRYLREREEMESTMPEYKANLKLAVDRAKYTQVTGIEEEADRKIKAHVSNKARKEDEEKMRREQERQDIQNYSSLAESIIAEMQKRRMAGNYGDDDSLVGLNRRKTTQFGQQMEFAHSDSVFNDGDEEQQEPEGPRYPRNHGRAVELPIHSSED